MALSCKGHIYFKAYIILLCYTAVKKESVIITSEYPI